MNNPTKSPDVMIRKEKGSIGIYVSAGLRVDMIDGDSEYTEQVPVQIYEPMFNQDVLLNNMSRDQIAENIKSLEAKAYRFNSEITDAQVKNATGAYCLTENDIKQIVKEIAASTSVQYVDDAEFQHAIETKVDNFNKKDKKADDATNSSD